MIEQEQLTTTLYKSTLYSWRCPKCGGGHTISEGAKPGDPLPTCWCGAKASVGKVAGVLRKETPPC